jgi:hypothetical protein
MSPFALEPNPKRKAFTPNDGRRPPALQFTATKPLCEKASNLQNTQDASCVSDSSVLVESSARYLSALFDSTSVSDIEQLTTLEMAIDGNHMTDRTQRQKVRAAAWVFIVFTAGTALGACGTTKPARKLRLTPSSSETSLSI